MLFLKGQFRAQHCLTTFSAAWTLGLTAPSASLLMAPPVWCGQHAREKRSHPERPWKNQMHWIKVLKH